MARLQQTIRELRGGGGGGSTGEAKLHQPFLPPSPSLSAGAAVEGSAAPARNHQPAAIESLAELAHASGEDVAALVAEEQVRSAAIDYHSHLESGRPRLTIGG
jgi:hypothetical protein